MRTARAVIAILILSGADACGGGGGDGVTTPTTPGGTTTQCADIGAVSNAPTPVSLWTQLQPTGTAPVARIAVAAALDAANDRLIVFGGKSAAGVLNDVWVLTNATGVSGTPAWTQLTPTGGPPTARNYAVATYDPASNRFSVYGGNNQSNQFLSDYWVLTNANGQGGTPVWSQVTPAGLPSARAQSAGASDPAGNRVLVFGGVACNSSSCTPYNDAYVASNASGATGTPTFTRLQGTGTNPAARYDATIAYDAAGNRMLMFGGQPSTSTSPDPSSRVADTWALSSANGTGAAAAWSLINTGTTTPPGREFHSAIYDATNTRLVIFGGAGTDNFTRSDTWTLTTSGTSGTWTSYAQNSSPRPAARSAHAAAYSPQQGRMVVFGGNLGASQYVNEVWVLRLTTTTVASVTILSAATSVCTNNTLKLVAVPRDASGTVVDAAVTWTSSDPGILNVGSDGTVTGIAAGTATATACVGSVCGTQSVRITAAAVTPGGGGGVTLRPVILAGQGVSGQIDLNGGAESIIFPSTLVATGGNIISGYTWTATSLKPLPHPAIFISPLGGWVTGRSSTFVRGTYTLYVTVRDDAGTSVDGSVTLNLTMTCSSRTADFNPCASVMLTTNHTDYMPAAKVGSAYVVSVIAGGGTPPYTWTLYSGSLPPGLVLDAARGVLRGTPTTAGTYNFFVKLTDSVGGNNLSELTAGVIAARFHLTVNP